MPGLAILGEQRGDEGKGRYVDMYMEQFDIGARFNGGANAGHTVCVDDTVYKLHGLPTSVVHPHAKSVMGNGVVINPIQLIEEIDTVTAQGVEITKDNLFISSAAHLILPSQISEDEIREAGSGRQGSTKSGIAQAYGAKAARLGLRAEEIRNRPDRLEEAVLSGLLKQSAARQELGLESIDIEETTARFMEGARRIGDFVTDTTVFLMKQLTKDNPASVLAEGAQAFLLDIDHGMYPMTTSSSTTIGGVSTGLGIPTKKYIDKVVGVCKVVQSHVGGGPFVTEIDDDNLLQRLHGDMSAVDAEKGTTTGRVRRLGHLDLPQIRRAQWVNGTDEMAITKLDWAPRYGDEVSVCTAYRRKGKLITMAPDASYKLEQSEPEYTTLPTWEEDIQDIREFRDLPENAQKYVKFIEEQTGVPITLIGVGPEREQYIKV